jgi:hypothetical protein
MPVESPFEEVDRDLLDVGTMNIANFNLAGRKANLQTE